jgi:hypothetical protein
VVVAEAETVKVAGAEVVEVARVRARAVARGCVGAGAVVGE